MQDFSWMYSFLEYKGKLRTVHNTFHLKTQTHCMLYVRKISMGNVWRSYSFQVFDEKV